MKSDLVDWLRKGLKFKNNVGFVNVWCVQRWCVKFNQIIDNT